MTAEQRNAIDNASVLLTLLQNKCTRAQSALIKAETAETEDEVNRLIEEARLELE